MGKDIIIFIIAMVYIFVIITYLVCSKNNKRRIVVSIINILLFIILFCKYAIYTRDKYIDIYNEGVSLLETGDYVRAVECFNEIPNYIDYKDISELLESYNYVCPKCGEVLERK